MSQNLLVFGATSAIVAEACRQRAAAGDRMFLVARSADKLQALIQELGPAVLGHALADLTRTQDTEGLVAQGWSALGSVDLVLIGHGLLSAQLATEADYAPAQECFEVNLLSVVALLVPVGNRLEGQGRGAVAVITSVAAERGRPRNYTYGAAKAALNTYLQGLRSRLYPLGIGVHAIKMGPVDTPMTVDHEKNPLFVSPERAAAGLLAAVEKGTPEAFVPGWWRGIMALVRRMPEPIYQRIGALSGR